MADDYSIEGRRKAESDAAKARPPARPSVTSRVAWLVFTLLVAAGLARLGVWQLHRAREKIDAAQLVASRAALPPLEAQALAREDRQAEPQWQRRIALRGRWLTAHTVWLANRTMDDRAGFFVLTPLELGPGDAVIVQRGWAPRDTADVTKLPPLATPAGEVEVQGRVAPWPSHWLELGSTTASGGARGPIRQNLDRATSRAETGLALRPVTIVEDATAANANDGLGRRWTPPAVDVSRHYGYAAQWFAMSATCLVLYVWLAWVRPRRSRPRTGAEDAAAGGTPRS